MANVDIVQDDLAKYLAKLLDPYQPDDAPEYPNPAPTAGKIPSTLIHWGEPIQVHVMRRLENGMCTVAVYEGKKSKQNPYTEDVGTGIQSNLSGGPPATGTETVVVDSEFHEICIEIWASSKEDNSTLHQILRPGLGTKFTLNHADGSQTLLKFEANERLDMEQVDSAYVRVLHYMADVTNTLQEEAVQITSVHGAVHSIDGPPAPYFPTVDQL